MKNYFNSTGRVVVAERKEKNIFDIWKILNSQIINIHI